MAGLDAFVYTNYGAFEDLRWQSPYTQLLNAVPDTVPHGFVATLCDPRWLEYRFGADSFSYPDDTLGGRNVALLAEGAYDGLGIAGDIWWFYAEDAYDDGDDDDGDYYSCLSDIAYDGQYWMDWIDYHYNDFLNHDLRTGDYDSVSDGLVSISSQIYPDPNAPGILITGGDSHVGATKSSYVREALDILLSNQLFAPPVITPPPPPPPPPSCTYSVTPYGLEVPYQGGGTEVVVYTAANCAWSASGNSPSSVQTYGGPGAGNGEAEWNFEPNLTPYPIQVTITVAGETFNITQDAKPSNVSVGIVNIVPCTPQDNCVNNPSNTAWTINVGNYTITKTCVIAAAFCLNQMEDGINYDPNSPISTTVDLDYTQLYISTTDPSYANAPYSTSIVNGPDMLLKVSTSSTNLAP